MVKTLPQKILDAFRAVKDKDVKTVLFSEADSVCALSFMHKHEDVFRAVMPTYYDEFAKKCDDHYCGRDIFVSRKDFLAYMCLETKLVKGDDFRTAEEFVTVGIKPDSLRYGDVPSSVELFAEGIKKKKGEDGRLLDFLKEKPDYLDYFLPLMFAVESEAFSAALTAYVRDAKLQDTVRYHTFMAMMRAKNANMLLLFLDEIDENNYYRFKMFSEAATMLGEYEAILSPKELVPVLRDAAQGNAKKYLNADYRHAYRFLDAYENLHPDKFYSFAVEALKQGGRARWAVLGYLEHEQLNEKYLEEIFSCDLSLEDLSFFLFKLRSALMPKTAYPVAFEGLYRLLMRMDKLNYHFKTDEDICFARDISRGEMAKVLGGIAAKADNEEYIKRLDGIYDWLKEEAQARYLEAVGDKTKLDTRLCAVKFLKTDNYFANRYFDDKKIALSYDEGVLVSEFLKSKKEVVKSKIIKAYLSSPDTDKIAEYLLDCREEYKRAVGEEIVKSRDKVDGEKLKKKEEYFHWNRESVFTVEKPTAEIEKLAAQKCDVARMKPISYEKLQEFVAVMENFIREHADYEYAAAYYDGLVQFGSGFHRLKSSAPGADGFNDYPLGGEIKELILNHLSEEEITGLYALLFCSKRCNKKVYTAVCDSGNVGNDEKCYDNFYDYFKPQFGGYCAPTPFGILWQLEQAIVENLLGEKEVLRLYAAFARASASFGKDDKFDYPRVCRNKLTKSKEGNTVEATVHVAAILARSGVESAFSYDLIGEAYERDLISVELARYLILEGGSFCGAFVPTSPQYVMRADYDKPKFKKLVLEFVEFALDAEFTRGSLQTPYSRLVGHTDRFYGAEKYFKAIVALRGLTWVRSPYGYDKNEILSCILKKSVKSNDDTYEKFSRLADEYKITDAELLRATLFNPEFVDFAAERLQIPHLKTAVFWFVAHLNEALYGEKQERRIEQIKEFSAISYPDFQDGAFDCEWYAEMTEKVPAEVLDRIYADAKFVTVGGLHKRAQRFFDAVGGRIKKEECLEKIRTTRNKDFCLVYSLIPIESKEDLYERYEVLAEFQRGSKQFGAQRQLSERRTVDIAMENLARVAGYAGADIFRFEMEAQTPSDIYHDYTVDDIIITPYIDVQKFKIAYTIKKGGKELTSIPSKYAKSVTVKELREQIKLLNQKFRRIVTGLENTMVTRILFSSEQLDRMCRERITAAVLGKLLLLADGKLCVYDGGLKDTEGKKVTAKEVYIAHAAELRKIGLLPDAVNYIVEKNIRQPFKQVLREIYTKTNIELTQDEVLRFRGFEVDLRKCISALKGKGWSVSEDIGLRKVYYRTDTVAAIFRECDILYSVDYENVNRELHGIFFLERKSGKIIPIKDVDDITFSETLRDVDLMISISSKVIYDFNLAMSTVEMRHAVLHSLSTVLHLDNVSLLKDNIKVAGTYGTYTVNIRTGLVFKEGKGNLALDTVYSVDKPILLDFVDEDPMTADIISKVIVLANDAAVIDPAILREIKD